jgi:predicted peptidase
MSRFCQSVLNVSGQKTGIVRTGLLTMACLLVAAIGRAADPDLPPFAPGVHTIQFTESCPQADAEEMKFRLHSLEDSGPFDISQARFQLLVPKNYRPDEAWGLFIWVSASDSPKIPAEWEAVLAARKLLFVGAFQSGNPRNIFDRMRMAVDASVDMRKRYRIDPRRVYISGFSGGARVASMLGVAFPDLFTGTIPFMGVNFYTDLPAENGKRFGISYIPDDQALAIAKKQCRYVLVTGEKDSNRDNTHSADENGFRKEGFTSVLCLDVPGLGHAMPPAEWLDKGLEFLDTGKER